MFRDWQGLIPFTDWVHNGYPVFFEQSKECALCVQSAKGIRCMESHGHGPAAGMYLVLCVWDLTVMDRQGLMCMGSHIQGPELGPGCMGSHGQGPAAGSPVYGTQWSGIGSRVLGVWDLMVKDWQQGHGVWDLMVKDCL